MDGLELFRKMPATQAQSLFRADGGADLDAIRATIFETCDVILIRDTTTLGLCAVFGAELLLNPGDDPNRVASIFVVELDFEPAEHELHRFLGLVEAVRGHQDSPFWKRTWHAVDGTTEEFVMDRTDPLYLEPTP